VYNTPTDGVKGHQKGEEPTTRGKVFPLGGNQCERRSSELTAVSPILLKLKAVLTCPLVRILFSSAEDFFRLEGRNTAQVTHVSQTSFYSLSSSSQAAQRAPRASSPVVGHGVWDGMRAFIGWVRSRIHLEVWKPKHNTHTHTQGVVKAKRQTDIWPDPPNEQ